MLEALAIILVLAWLLAVVFSNPLGGGIHLLLVLAFIAITVRCLRGHKPLA